MTKKIKDVNDILVHYGKDALVRLVREAEAAFQKPAEIREHKDNGKHNDAEKPSPSAAIHVKDEDGSVTIRGDRVTFNFGDRMYEVDALSRNRAPGTLGVTIHAHRGDALFSSKIEMYHPKEVAQFTRACAARLETEEDIIDSDMRRMLARLKDLQDKQIEEKQKPKPKRIVPAMSEPERRAAMELLTSPDLIQLIIRHFAESGYVGEEMNLLTGYIACTSRLLSKPVHLLFQSSTAAGKTTLMKAAVGMMPPECVFSYSAVSPKAMQYMQEHRDLRHAVFLLEEDKRLDDWTREMIKLLKTEGRASSMITIKDPETGMMTAVDFFVEGPLCFLMTTTILMTDEEQVNRDLVCSADESKEQTSRILSMQRILRTLEGRKITERKEELRKLHQNAQRLLRKITVLNPYAPYMTFPEHAHRLRRDHEKYQGIIEAVTLLHQYQRPVKTRKRPDGTLEEYIETTLEDIETANRIAVTVLGQSIDDCPAHTRTFMEHAAALVDEIAEKQGIDRNIVRVTARELADYTGLSVQMVRRHLARLSELELAHPDFGKNNPFRSYALLYQRGTEGGRFLAGLLDTRELARRAGVTGNSESGTGN